MDVRAVFGDSRLNNGRTIDVISSTFLGPPVPDICVKFGDPRLNLYRAVPPEAV